MEMESDPILQVAERLRELCDALELTDEQIAADCGCTVSSLQDYKSGHADIPVSFLHRLASRYGVELTALLFGEEPRMSAYYVTRAGKGPAVSRRAAYKYEDLAGGFIGRRMVPFIVTVEPSLPDSPVSLNSHEGQEFNYVLAGELEMHIAGKRILLHPGDTIMFDAARPHGFRCSGDSPARFIAIID